MQRHGKRIISIVLSLIVLTLAALSGVYAGEDTAAGRDYAEELQPEEIAEKMETGKIPEEENGLADPEDIPAKGTQPDDLEKSEDPEGKEDTKTEEEGTDTDLLLQEDSAEDEEHEQTAIDAQQVPMLSAENGPLEEPADRTPHPAPEPAAEPAPSQNPPVQNPSGDSKVREPAGVEQNEKNSFETQEQTDSVQEQTDSGHEEQSDPAADPLAGIFIQLQTDGGCVQAEYREHLFSLSQTDGKVSVISTNEKAAYPGPEGDGWILTADPGTEVRITLTAEEEWEIAQLYVQAGTELDAWEEAAGQGSYSFSVSCDETMPVIRAAFQPKKQGELYPVEDYEIQALSGLDFSSARLIIGTRDPSVFVDRTVIISELNGLYLLQFSDPETARKACAYYSRYADIAEPDTKVMAVNGEAGGQEGGMTEVSNPFAEAAAAADQGCAVYDVAIIDTGANGFVSAAVSVTGSDPGDSNGHGTRMAQLIKEQHPGARILSIKAFENSGLADLSAVYAAFQYAMTQQIGMICICATAISGSGSSLISEAVQSALGSGIMVVASAGNNGRDAAYYVPAGIPGVLTIGACAEDGTRIASSNYGQAVDYNVTADSTSEAAAKFSGWLCANGMDAIPDAIGRGLIFPVDYEPREPETSNETADRFRALMLTEPDASALNAFLGSLCKEQARDLYSVLSYEEIQDAAAVFLQEYMQAHDADTALSMVSEQMKDLFCTEVFLLSSAAGSDVTVGNGSGTVYPYTAHQYGEFDDPATWLFSAPYYVSTASGTYKAFCAEASSDAPVGKVSSVISLSNDVKTKIFLISPAGPLYAQYKAAVFDGWLAGLKYAFAPGVEDEYKDYCLSHLLISGVYSNDWGDRAWTQESLNVLKAAVSKIDQLISNDNPYYRRAQSHVVRFGMGETGLDVQDVYWVEITENGSVSFAKTAGSNTGTLTVRKVLTGTEGAEQSFTFTLTVNNRPGAGYSYAGSRSGRTSGTGQFVLKAGEYVTISGLSAGASYKVTEEPVITSAGNERFQTTVTDAGGQVRTGREVTGTIGGSSSGQRFTFTVTGLTGTHPYTIYYESVQAGTGSVSSGGTISLSSGQTVTIGEIPDGTKVRITETLPSSGSGTWTCSQTGNYVEVSAEAGQNKNAGTFTNTFTPAAQTVMFANEVRVGYVQLKKTSQSAQICEGNALYSLQGAVYEVYDSADLNAAHRKAVLTTKADGSTDPAELPAGTYYIVETRASAGHEKDPAASAPRYLTVTVNRSHTAASPAVVTSSEPVQYTPLVINITKDSGDYPYPMPLSGVVFELSYYDNLQGSVSGPPKRTWNLITKEGPEGTYRAELKQDFTGEGSDPLYLIGGEAVMPLGTYQLREKSTVPGYTLSRGYLWADQKPDQRTDTETGSVIFVVKEEAGTVRASAGNRMSAFNRPVRIDTEALGSTAGNDINETHYMDASVNFGVIEDTVRFDNLTEGALYRITGRVYDVTAGGKNLYGTVQDEFTAGSRDEEGFVLYFPVYGLKDLVGHTLVVGEMLEESTQNGFVKTAEETDLTSAKQAVHVIAIDTELTWPETGNHTAGPGEIVVTDRVDYRGLLPGDTFILKGELIDRQTRITIASAQKTFTAEKADGSESLEFSFTAEEGHTYVAVEYLYTGGHLITSHTDLDDEDQSVYVPRILTTMTDEKDQRHDAMAEEEICLTDAVTYQNLIPGQTYTVKGTLMNRRTSEPAVDDEGNSIQSETTFVPEQSDGTAAVEFRFCGVQLKGESVVAFESLEHNGAQIAVHADITAKEQAVVIPKIRTILTDPADGTHEAMAAEQTVLQDEVLYEQLLPGEEYTLQGVLMDKETGKPVTDADGKEVRAQTSFVPAEPDGTAFVTFRFRAGMLAGRTVVAFEKLYAKDKLTAVHEQLDDAAQTLTFPRIWTTLCDEADGDKDALADPGNGTGKEIVLTDTVDYENLIAGENYVLEGILMDKETKEPALDDYGKKIRAEASFTPQESGGSVNAKFCFEGRTLKGHTLVAVEQLYHNGKMVAIHSDLDSFDQSAWLPRIETSLYTASDQEKDLLASADIELMDEVTYHNLLPGREYRVYGRLMDKETGKAVYDDRGEIITAEAVFTPSEPDGSIILTFRFPGLSLAGKSVVAFEELYRLNKKAAVHADICAQEQTVHIPSLRTTLADPLDKEKDANASDKMVLTDRVILKGLIPGRKYTVKGVLMEKQSRNPARDDRGKEIRAETSFKADQESMEVDVVFEFPGTSLAGCTLVAFEELYREGRFIAQHQDLNDQAQTMQIPKIRTSLKNITQEDGEDFRKGWICLTDEVQYQNLIPGKRYRISGVLYQKSTGKPAADDHGDTITAQTEFTAGEADGKVEVLFRFQGCSLQNQEIVAFEQLHTDHKLVAVHEDLQDKAQCLTLPAIPVPPVPVPDRPGIPKTSDPSGLGGWLAAAAISAGICIASAVLLLRKRKKY